MVQMHSRQLEVSLRTNIRRRLLVWLKKNNRRHHQLIARCYQKNYILYYP
jgi:hypothetical protein